MTDIDPAGSAPLQNGEPPAGGFGMRILAQFIRDLSFEEFRESPESLQSTNAQPQIDIGVELNARARNDGLFEVDIKFTAGAKSEADTVFQIELVYGGLFQIAGVPEDQMEPFLLIECPRLLFPFMRKVVADLTTDGGFPPFLLDPIDFAAIYMARRGQLEGAPAGQA